MKKLSKFSHLHTSATRVDPRLEAGHLARRVDPANAHRSLFVDGLTPVNSMWITGTITAKQKSEAKRPRPLRGLQVDFSLTRNVSYAVR